jgi:hypothetical protein
VEGKVVVQIEWKDLKEAAADLNKESLCWRSLLFLDVQYSKDRS